MEVSQQIAKKIRRQLKQLKIRDYEFADLMNTTPSHVSRWLSGTHNFNVSTLANIQNVLGINFFDFSDEEENKNYCYPCTDSGFVLSEGE